MSENNEGTNFYGLNESRGMQGYQVVGGTSIWGQHKGHQTEGSGLV